MERFQAAQRERQSSRQFLGGHVSNYEKKELEEMAQAA
jgi:hypothetical protein